MSFFQDVFPMLLISGFFVAMGMIISWSKPGLNFEAAWKAKPWRRNATLALGLYIVGLCIARFVSDGIAVAQGYQLTQGNMKELFILFTFLLLGVTVSWKAFKRS